jgi:hypothetical protein
MNDLSSLLGGQVPANISELTTKFEQGQHDQVPDDQVQQAYSQEAAQLPHDQYVQAAEAAFSRLTPDQRAQFASELQAKAQQAGLAVPASQSVPNDPGGLASATGAVHAQQPGMLQKLFSPGGAFSSPIAKAALLGITAMAAQGLTDGRR